MDSSLRAIAVSSNLSPATYSRLARALSYRSYEELREGSRKRVSGTITSMAERAKRLRMAHRDKAADTPLERHGAAGLGNVHALIEEIDEQRLMQAAKAMLGARKVSLVGALGSSGLLDYFAYMAGWFLPNWSVAGRNGMTFASMLANLGKRLEYPEYSCRPCAESMPNADIPRLHTVAANMRCCLAEELRI